MATQWNMFTSCPEGLEHLALLTTSPFIKFSPFYDTPLSQSAFLSSYSLFSLMATLIMFASKYWYFSCLCSQQYDFFFLLK